MISCKVPHMRRLVTISTLILLSACGVQPAVSGGDGYGHETTDAHETTTTYHKPHDTSTSTTVVVTNPQGNTTTSARAPGTMIPICHHLGPNQGFVEIEIRADELEAHLLHGDLYPVPRFGCPPAHESTTTSMKPPHQSTTSTSVNVSTTSTTVGGVTTTTTIKQTTTTVGGVTTTVRETTTTAGGVTTSSTTTTTTGGGGGTTTTSTGPTTPSSSSTTTSTTPGGPSTSASTTTASPQTTSSTSSSTVPSSTTTTILGETVFLRAAGTVCQTGVPKIQIDFGNLTEFAGRTGTLTMSDINGNVLSVQPLVYEPGTTVFLLYPGSAVDPVTGEVTDVPGWNLNADGFWVQDPSDEILREGINLLYEVNPSATAFVTYPPESSGCATPTGPFPPGQSAPAPGALPVTGSGWVQTVSIGTLLFGAGWFLVRMTRRRVR